MTDKKISALTLLAAADLDPATDYLPIVDTSEAAAADKNKRILASSLRAVGDHAVLVHTGNGHGSTNTKIRRFTTAQTNVGTAITYADSAADGATFTINETGLYSIYSLDVYTSAGNTYHGASVNSAELTTSVVSIAAANRLMVCSNIGANVPGVVSRTVRLASGDVVRPHTNGVNDSASALSTVFAISKVGQ